MVNAQICFINIDFFEYSGIGGGKFRLTGGFFLKLFLSLVRCSDVLFSDRYRVLGAGTPIQSMTLPNSNKQWYFYDITE